LIGVVHHIVPTVVHNSGITLESSNQIQYFYRLKYSYYFRLKTPSEIRIRYPDFKKEIKKTLNTTNQNKARKLSSLWYNELSLLFDAIIFNQENCQITIQSIYNHISLILSTNYRTHKITHILEYLDKQMSDNKKEFNVVVGLDDEDDFEIRGSTEGNTPEEKAEDAINMANFFIKLQNDKSSSAVSTTTSTMQLTNEKSKLAVRKSKLSDLIANFLAADKNETTEQTHDQKSNRLDTIKELMGDRVCSELTNEDAQDFLAKLKRLPSRVEKRVFDERLLTHKHKCISKSTVNNYLKLFKRMCQYGSTLNNIDPNKENFITHDISATLDFKFSKKYDSKGYVPFNSRDLKNLFNVDFVYGTDKGSRTKFASWMFWMPLMGLYTGARIAELAQLHVNDIKFELPLDNPADLPESISIDEVNDGDKGIWCISINDNDNKSIKNKQSIRNVPIHSTLLELGFLDFVREKRYGKYKHMLFTNFSDSAVSNNNCGGQVSKWFNGNYGTKSNLGFKQAAGISSESSKTFHSLRKTFSRYLRINFGIGNDIIGDIIGHEVLKVDGGNDVTLEYTGAFPLEILNIKINKLHYDFDLSHISYAKFLKMYDKEYKKLLSEQKKYNRNSKI